MIAISRERQAKDAAARWKAQYQLPDKTWKVTNNGDSQKVYSKLIALGENPNPDDVNEAIGNMSWTLITCDECRKDATKGIVMGNNDYSSTLCETCLKDALTLIEVIT